jgi:thiamine pyrophosphokinase
MKWPEFLSNISNQAAVVGPMLERARPVVMPTVFVDGGSDFLKESLALSPREWPVISVGDGDSAAGALDERLPARKDYSDLAFVLRGLPASVTSLELFGFLGGRRDHELANFGEVHNFLAARAQAVANFHEDSSISVIGFTGRLEMEIDGVFSVLAFESADVNISGDCEYKYDGPIEPVVSLGLSNAGHGRVALRAESPAFLFLN